PRKRRSVSSSVRTVSLSKATTETSTSGDCSGKSWNYCSWMGESTADLSTMQTRTNGSTQMRATSFQLKANTSNLSDDGDHTGVPIVADAVVTKLSSDSVHRHGTTFRVSPLYRLDVVDASTSHACCTDS